MPPIQKVSSGVTIGNGSKNFSSKNLFCGQMWPGQISNVPWGSGLPRPGVSVLSEMQKGCPHEAFTYLRVPGGGPVAGVLVFMASTDSATADYLEGGVTC